MPLPKRKCGDRIFSSECDSLVNANPEAEDFYTCAIKGKFDGGAGDDEPKVESKNDSNSLPGNANYSVMSVSSDAKTEFSYILDNRFTTKSSADKEKSACIGGEHNSPSHDFGLHTSVNYKEYLQEFGNYVYYCNLEYINGSLEKRTDKEPEEMLYSNGVNPNNYVLSSGRWNVNRETQPGSKKLTIDKEFEQYFSMLLL